MRVAWQRPRGMIEQAIAQECGRTLCLRFTRKETVVLQQAHALLRAARLQGYALAVPCSFDDACECVSDAELGLRVLLDGMDDANTVEVQGVEHATR